MILSGFIMFTANKSTTVFCVCVLSLIVLIFLAALVCFLSESQSTEGEQSRQVSSIFVWQNSWRAASHSMKLASRYTYSACLASFTWLLHTIPWCIVFHVQRKIEVVCPWNRNLHLDILCLEGGGEVCNQKFWCLIMTWSGNRSKAKDFNQQDRLCGGQRWVQ